MVPKKEFKEYVKDVDPFLSCVESILELVALYCVFQSHLNGTILHSEQQVGGKLFVRLKRLTYSKNSGNMVVIKEKSQYLILWNSQQSFKCQFVVLKCSSYDKRFLFVI